jgi:asparagine synthase (glutamine-hydrolysing)
VKLQFGLLHADGKPATQDEVSALLGEFARRPAETSGEIVDGSLLMAYRGDKITYEEDSELQPLVNGPYVLTWDGRLDNREDLARRLDLTHVENIPDPVIVLNSYKAFGEPVFGDLIGEFALTLWCSRTRSLLCARSVCGARPLYYTLTKGTLFWSSDYAQLVRASNVELDVNEDYFLEYLLTQPSTRHTPLSQVYAVPANCFMRFENGRAGPSRELWNPNRIRDLSYRSDREYEEHFREALADAVRVRLRAKPPIFSELSGGLDSSAIVLTADEILKGKNQPLENVRTVSCVYEESETCDEQKFIRAVEDRRGAETVRVWEKDQRFTLGLQDLEFTGVPNPLHCSPGRYETFTALMKASKSRLLLTGLGGDHLCWSGRDGTPLVADELRRGNLLAAHRECRVWSHAACVPYLQLLFNKAVPLAFGGSCHMQEKPKWLSQKMKGNVSKHMLCSVEDEQKHVTPSRRAQEFSADLLFRTVAASYFSEYRHLYVSHPYTHRPFVEFCLSTPLSQFLRAGQTRSLMRRALADVLPTKICKRLSKTGVDEAYVRAWQREWARNSDVRSWSVSERGLVDPDHLSNSINSMRLGIEDLSGPLMRLVSIERWLRSLGRIRRRCKSIHGAPHYGRSIAAAK